MEEKEKPEKKICLQCGRGNITPGTPEEEYRQMDICRNQEWIDYRQSSRNFWTTGCNSN